MPERAAGSVRVVKRKWDHSISTVDSARALAVPGEMYAWFVAAGSRRERPGAGETKAVVRDELWVSVPGEWWVLCGYADGDRTLTGYKVHAAAPFETPLSDVEIEWIDLDLDYEISDDGVVLQDETQFHEHARTMGYPAPVVRGAWEGISTIAARYTNREWPFDGSLQKWVDGA